MIEREDILAIIDRHLYGHAGPQYRAACENIRREIERLPDLAQAAPTCGLRDRLERVLSEWWFWEISEISAKGRAEILDGLMAATLSSTVLCTPEEEK